MISEKTVDNVFALARIEEVVEDYVTLRRSGSNFTGLCPFHDEKTPSFMVSPGKNIYKCFGCGRGGNPVNFVMEHEKFSFPEAIKQLAGKYHITIEETEQSEEYKQEKLLVESYYIINEFAQAYFVKNLFESEEGKSIGLSYFKERGFIDKTIKTFGLGYAPYDKTEFIKKAMNAQYKEEYLMGVGLMSTRKFDFFNQRVMFPIHNMTGRVIGFAGRILTANKKAPKYINSKESEIYNKRSILYGMYQAKDQIRKQDACFLVEGYTDVISMHQTGVENVVASSGTSLTIGQVKLIKRFTENLFMLFDGDNAGIKAAMRGVDIVLEQDMNVKVVMLPDGEDPDSFVKSVGHSGFSEFVDKNATDFIQFRTNLFLKESANDPIARSEFIGGIVKSLSKIPNTIKRSLYVQQCSESLNIDEKILVSEINKEIYKDIKQKSKERTRRADPDEPPPGFFEPGAPKTDEKKVPQINRFESIDSDSHQERAVMKVFVCYGGNYHPEENVSVAEYLYDKIKQEISLFENKDYVILLEAAMEYINKRKKELGIIDKTESDPLFDDESNENDRTEVIEIINTKFYTQHANEIIRNIAIDLLSEPYSYANWENKGVELQTQNLPEENYLRDGKEAILRFKMRKIKISLKAINDRIEKANKNENDEGDQIIKLMQAYKMTLEYRNNIAAELNNTVIT